MQICLQKDSVTQAAVKKGAASVNCKGKVRTILIPHKLCALLSAYVRDEGVKNGAVFVTRTGKPIDRSNIWAEMKKLCSTVFAVCR